MDRAEALTLRCLVVLLAACDPPLPTVGDPPQSFRASADVWSGGELTVTSPGFAPAQSALPDVLLDGLSLLVRRVDDTTVIAALPDLPGQHMLRLVAPGVESQAIVVQLRGFEERVAGPLISGRTEPAREHYHLFGNGPTNLRRWNVRTNKAVDLADTVHAAACTRGVGPGPNVGEVVLLTGGCATGRWMLWRTEPLVPLSDTTSAQTDHFVAVLGAGRWVVVGADAFSVVACDGGSCSSESIPAHRASDVVRSPRGDRAALITRIDADLLATGVPVVDVALGTVGYSVPALGSAHGGAFSAGGDTLYLAGDSASTSLLVAVRASDGQLLASRRLNYEPCAVAADQLRPWLYVAGGGPQAFLQVFDRRTMTAITTLRVTSDTLYGRDFCRILPNPLERRVYVVDTWVGEYRPLARAQLYSFQTPP